MEPEPVHLAPTWQMITLYNNTYLQLVRQVGHWVLKEGQSPNSEFADKEAVTVSRN